MSTNNTSTSSGDAQGADQNSSAQGATSASQGDTSTASTSSQLSYEALKLRYEEMERDNKKYRDRFKKQDAEAAQAAQAAQAAEEDRLRKQGEFETLAKQHEARVKELEPQAEQLQRLAELMHGQIDTDIKEWPAELKAFDPGKSAPVDQRLEWMQKSKPLLEKLTQQARGAKPGNGPNPQPAQHTPEMKQNEFEKKLAAAGKYPRL